VNAKHVFINKQSDLSSEDPQWKLFCVAVKLAFPIHKHRNFDLTPLSDRYRITLTGICCRFGHVDAATQ